MPDNRSPITDNLPVIPFWLRIGELICRFLRPFHRRGDWLILKPGSLGDAFLFTGAIRELRRQFPRDRIILSTDWSAGVVLRRSPHVDNLYVVDESLNGHDCTTRLHRLVFAIKLFRRRYEVVLCPFYTKNETWAWGVLALADADHKYYYEDDHLPQPFTPPAGCTAIPIRREIHELDKIAIAFQTIGCKEIQSRKNIWPETYIRDDEQQWAEETISSLRKKAENPFVLSLCPGARFKQKSWGIENYVWLLLELACLLKQKWGRTLKVVVLGGVEDNETAQELIALSRQVHDENVKYSCIADPLFLDLTGKCTLHGSMAVIAESDLCLGNDTLGLHVAIAVGIPSMVVMWGGSADQWIPWGDAKRHRMVRANVDCRGCQGACIHRDFECMKRITVDMVLEATRPLLDLKDSGKKQNTHDFS